MPRGMKPSASEQYLERHFKKQQQKRFEQSFIHNTQQRFYILYFVIAKKTMHNISGYQKKQ